LTGQESVHLMTVTLSTVSTTTREFLLQRKQRQVKLMGDYATIRTDEFDKLWNEILRLSYGWEISDFMLAVSMAMRKRLQKVL